MIETNAISAFSRAIFDHRIHFRAGPRVGLEQPDRSSPAGPNNSPTLGAVHDDERMSGVADVANETGKDTSESQHSTGLDRSIRPGVPVPATLLVAQMCDGALLLQGWRSGPSAYVISQDAEPLRHALATAFGSAGHGTTTDQPQS